MREVVRGLLFAVDDQAVSRLSELAFGYFYLVCFFLVCF